VWSFLVLLSGALPTPSVPPSSPPPPPAPELRLAAPPKAVTQDREMLPALLKKRNGAAVAASIEVSPELRAQKIAAGVPAGAGSDLARPLAALLDAEWREEKQCWQLRRRPEVEQMLVKLRQARAARALAVVEECRRRGLESLKIALAGVDQPELTSPDGIRYHPNVIPGMENAVRFLGTLSSEQSARVMTPQQLPSRRGGDRGFQQSRTPGVSLPFDRLSRQQQDWLAATLAASGCRLGPKGTVVQLIRTLTLVYLTFRWPSGASTTLHAFYVVIGPETRAYYDEALHPLTELDEAIKAENRKQLERLDTLRPEKNDVRWVELDFAQAVLQLSQQLQLPVLADYYTHPVRLTINQKGLSAAALAEQVATKFGCAVFWVDGVLLLRSVNWPVLDERELPDEFFARWEATVQAPGRDPRVLDLDELAELARAVSPAQLDCLECYRSRGSLPFGPGYEAQALWMERELLLFYGDLPANARQQLLSTGIRLVDLAGPARERIVQLLTGEAPELLESAPDRVSIRLTPSSEGSSLLLELSQPGRAPRTRRTDLIGLREKEKP
jgi:hypothetical protein